MYLTTIIKKGSKPNTYDVSYIHYPGDISENIHASLKIITGSAEIYWFL